jgi:hypothetical protein
VEKKPCNFLIGKSGIQNEERGKALVRQDKKPLKIRTIRG